MPASKNLAAYTDCHSAFEMALEHGGAKIEFETSGKARNFSQRCYQYRRLLHSKAEASSPPGTITSTPYDQFKIRLSGMFLIIEPHSLKGVKMTTLDGDPIKPEGAKVDRTLSMPDPEHVEEVHDELLEEAHDIAEEIRRTGGLTLE